MSKMSHFLPHRSRFVATQTLIWCLASPLLGVAAARVAVWAQRVRAPVLIFPLLVGCGVGLALAALMRLAQIGHRPTLVFGAVLAALLAAAGQHYFSYRDYVDARATFLAQKPENAMLEALGEKIPVATPGFAGYMCGQARVGRPLFDIKGETVALRGATAWASWGIDGLITLASAVAIVYVFARSPYCNACRSWYRTVRSGRLGSDIAPRLADAADMPIEQPVAAAHYRLTHCASGCGSARLELTWETSEGRVQRGEAWLDSAAREGVMKVLDGQAQNT
jgi:hypothetical protein